MQGHQEGQIPSSEIKVPKLPVDQKGGSFAGAWKEKVPSMSVAVNDRERARIVQAHPWLERRTEYPFVDAASLGGQRVPNGVNESRKMRSNALDHFCQALRRVELTDIATERRCFPPFCVDTGPS